jgi:hypothetical protein
VRHVVNIDDVPSTRGSALTGAAAAFAVVALIVFAGVAIHELRYASDHPYQYGPAKVIAWAAGAGGLLSIAIGLLAAAAFRAKR